MTLVRMLGFTHFKRYLRNEDRNAADNGESYFFYSYRSVSKTITYSNS